MDHRSRLEIGGETGRTKSVTGDVPSGSPVIPPRTPPCSEEIGMGVDPEEVPELRSPVLGSTNPCTAGPLSFMGHRGRVWGVGSVPTRVVGTRNEDRFGG